MVATKEAEKPVNQYVLGNRKVIKNSDSAPNWWDEDYLFYQLSGPLHGVEMKDAKIYRFCKDLVQKIIKSKRFNLPSEYHYYFLEMFNNGLGEDGEIIFTYNHKAVPLEETFRHNYRECLKAITSWLYHELGKFPIGVAGEIPLWAQLPREWFDDTGHFIRYYSFNGFLLRFSRLLTGEGRQGSFDKLFIPAKDKWPIFSQINLDKIKRFQKNIVVNLGFEDGLFGEDDYLSILSQAFFTQKYQLVEGFPVLIKLENHPEIRDIILKKRGSNLVCKINTYVLGSLLHVTNLEVICNLDLLTYFEMQFVGIENFDENRVNPISLLIASIYRDLVTVEEKEIGTRRVAGKRKPDLKTKAVNPLEPKLFTTSWQYIPRRQYVYNRSNDESFMDREPLSEADQHKQRAIRKWHMVCGHIRRYRDKPDWMASGDKQDQALADGVILRTGETYVRPHARNAGALEELGEIDINSIPHYMRRKFK